MRLVHVTTIDVGRDDTFVIAASLWARRDVQILRNFRTDPPAQPAACSVGTGTIATGATTRSNCRGFKNELKCSRICPPPTCLHDMCRDSFTFLHNGITGTKSLTETSV
jgi:hypothetical protein